MIHTKRLNIAIVCDPLTHLVSGSMISTLRFAEMLSKKGHNIIFIAAKDKKKREIDYYNNLKIYRFISFALPGSNGQYVLSFPTISRLKKILIHENIDIVHIIDPTPSSFICIKAAKILDIKIVAHSHMQPENISFNFPKIMQGKRLNNLLYHYMIWLYHQVDIVICPSHFAEKLLRKYDKEIKIAVISNGVNFNKFKKQNYSRFIKKYNLNENDKKILYVGRLNDEKSVETLIEAMPYILKEYQNVQLEIIGKGNLLPELKQLAKELHLQNKIKFFGYVPEKELLMAYNACDIFVLPSIAELEGMVVLEAMACAKPIIVSDSKKSASSDLVQDNGLIFKLQKPKDLAQKVLLLLKNKNLRLQMGKKSYIRAKKFDINKSVIKLENLYYSLLKDQFENAYAKKFEKHTLELQLKQKPEISKHKYEKVM